MNKILCFLCLLVFLAGCGNGLTPSERMLNLIDEGNISRLDAMIQADPTNKTILNATRTTDSNSNLLVYALKQHKSPEIIQGIVKCGFDPSLQAAAAHIPFGMRENPTIVLITALDEGYDLEILTFLIKNGAKVVGEKDCYPLIAALKRGDPTITQLLLAALDHVQYAAYTNTSFLTREVTNVWSVLVQQKNYELMENLTKALPSELARNLINQLSQPDLTNASELDEEMTVWGLQHGAEPNKALLKYAQEHGLSEIVKLGMNTIAGEKHGLALLEEAFVAKSREKFDFWVAQGVVAVPEIFIYGNVSQIKMANKKIKDDLQFKQAELMRTNRSFSTFLSYSVLKRNIDLFSFLKEHPQFGKQIANELKSAITRNDPAAVDFLIQQGVRGDKKTLEYCAISGSDSSLLTLLSYVELNKEERTTIFINAASRNCKSEVLTRLIEAGVDVNRDMVVANVVKSRISELINAIISQGADVNAVFRYALKFQFSSDEIKTLLNNKFRFDINKFTDDIVMNPDNSIFDELADRSSNPLDVDKYMAAWCRKGNNPQLLVKLIARGAKLTEQHMGFLLDRKQITPEMFSAALTQWKNDGHEIDQKWIFNAVWRRNLSVARILLENNVDPNSCQDGKSLLMISAQQTSRYNEDMESEKQMVQLLLKYGADPEYFNKDNMRAIDYARADKRTEIIKILLDAESTK